MSETRDCGLLYFLNGRINLIKVTDMEAPNVAPSFLCFLPEFQCSPANILYINGITETTGIQHISGKAVSLPLQNNKMLHETIDLTNRLSNASLEGKPCFSNGFAQSQSSLGCNICSVEIPEEEAVSESLEMAAGTDGDLSPLGIVEKRAQHELLNWETVTGTHISGNRESGSDQVAECNGNHVLIEDLTGETDVLAFEITEFFDAFRDGQEHKLLKFTKKSDLLLPAESSLEPEGGQCGARLNSALTIQHLKSDKEATPVDVDRIDGRISSSASRSGKWNGFLEGDSFSGTFSGPLTFSGPMSFSGNSGHGAYSGSVSHRSDSSTASTHSFAFPILPYEWNSSPVKMAQPDKRFIQRPWKRRLRNLFCCGSFK